MAIAKKMPIRVMLSAALLAACSSSNPAKFNDGTSAAGGTGTGGASGAGGSSTGGQPGSGGQATTPPGTGGNIATGGAGTGGQTATGGRTDATGGAAGATSPASGGTARATGGTTGPGTGGSPREGGVGGGTPGTGGAAGSLRDSGASGGAATGGTSGGGPDGGTLSTGCGKPLTRPSASAQQTLAVGGTNRSYLIDVPSTATNQTPLMLIFALHGYGMTNSSVVGSYNFTSRSNGQAITVYPQGQNNAWNSDDTDYAFMEALVSDLKGRYCVDPNRIYLTGFSNGGVFANDVACQRSSLFRAYAPVEGCGPGGLNAKLSPVCAVADAKPAVMVIVGNSDTTATPEQAQATRDFWVKRNGCSQTTTASYTGCVTYSGCPEGKPIVYCHGNWNHTISTTATADAWAFFNDLR
jgi:poly(3-hydroxybutyrate) depolymerase